METPKRNTGGKGKVVFDTRKPPRMPYKAFQIEDCSDAEFHPPLVTMESKIAEFEETARRHSDWKLQAEEKADAKGAAFHTEEEKVSRAKAAHWRKLASLPEAEIEGVDWQCWTDVLEGIDFLLARAEHSDCAKFHLSTVVTHALEGLNALAAHGNTTAARHLVDCLGLGVRGFELLAWHRPELFTHCTSKLALIPATISPQSGNQDACRELMDKLKVGEKSIYDATSKGKGKPRRQTKPANDFVSRLVNYMCVQRSEAFIYGYKIKPQLYADWPDWFSRLTQLSDFGARAWTKWGEVGWEIVLDVTGGKPEQRKELRPLGKSAETKKPRLCKELHSATRESNVRAKIKERLLQAFRRISNKRDE